MLKLSDEMFALDPHHTAKAKQKQQRLKTEAPPKLFKSVDNHTLSNVNRLDNQHAEAYNETKLEIAGQPEQNAWVAS